MPVSARGRPARPFVDVLLHLVRSIEGSRSALSPPCSAGFELGTRQNRLLRLCHALRTRENSFVVADAGTRGKSSDGSPHARQYPCPLKLGSMGLPQSQGRPNPVGDARSIYFASRDIPNVSRALEGTEQKFDTKPPLVPLPRRPTQLGGAQKHFGINRGTPGRAVKTLQPFLHKTEIDVAIDHTTQVVSGIWSSRQKE